ncbi:MAG: bifunctional proline dehydrogenase/L-glutamate gamma-semialdehyde dehydrogenase, partial [Pseudomonadota bacterium]
MVARTIADTATDRQTVAERLFPQPAAATGSATAALRGYHADEARLVETLVAEADAGGSARDAIGTLAADLVRRVRDDDDRGSGLDAFLQQYDLSSQEGVVLMCIAEALLRIPDADTADQLIADKIAAGQWDEHLGSSHSVFVNASTWGLMLTGRLLALDDSTVEKPGRLLGRLVNRAGEPVVRAAMRQAMRI